MAESGQNVLNIIEWVNYNGISTYNWFITGARFQQIEQWLLVQALQSMYDNTTMFYSWFALPLPFACRGLHVQHDILDSLLPILLVFIEQCEQNKSYPDEYVMKLIFITQILSYFFPLEMERAGLVTYFKGMKIPLSNLFELRARTTFR